MNATVTIFPRRRGRILELAGNAQRLFEKQELREKRRFFQFRIFELLM
jgi:hypothetical protein